MSEPIQTPSAKVVFMATIVNTTRTISYILEILTNIKSIYDQQQEDLAQGFMPIMNEERGPPIFSDGAIWDKLPDPTKLNNNENEQLGDFIKYFNALEKNLKEIIENNEDDIDSQDTFFIGMINAHEKIFPEWLKILEQKTEPLVNLKQSHVNNNITKEEFDHQLEAFDGDILNADTLKSDLEKTQEKIAALIKDIHLELNKAHQTPTTTKKYTANLIACITAPLTGLWYIIRILSAIPKNWYTLANTYTTAPDHRSAMLYRKYKSRTSIYKKMISRMDKMKNEHDSTSTREKENTVGLKKTSCGNAYQLGFFNSTNGTFTSLRCLAQQL